MKLSYDFIEELKFRNNIVDVVGNYVNLKRAGANYVANCPFHSEKTPSFVVFTKNDSCHCFGCGAGGDVISFIMKIENVDYMSAIEILCKRAGISMPVSSEKESITIFKRKRILEMNKDAAKYFNTLLTSGNFHEANEYIKNRQLSALAVKRYGIGYAPASFDTICNHLMSLGYNEEEITSGFLGGKSKKNGKVYDYFRNRLMFPIIDTSGNVIAFGGRIIGDGEPKYLNSSDTVAFKKSKNLFSINYAKNSKADYFILCEGYMDVIAMNMAGFSSAVASLGTALTPEQANLMKKYKSKVVISYDNDNAGKNAAKRAIPILKSAGLEIKVLQMNGAKDPDEFIKKFGVDRLKMLVDDSIGQFDFQSEEIIKKYNIDLPDEKVKASKELTELIAKTSSDVERDVYIQKIAKKIDVSEVSLKNDVEKRRKSYLRIAKHEEENRLMRNSGKVNDRINLESAKNIRASNAEETILGIIQISPEFLKKIRKDRLLCEEDFVTEFNKMVFSKISEAYFVEEKFDIAMIGNYFSADEISKINAMRIHRQMLENNDFQIVCDNIKSLKEEKTKKEAQNSDASIDSIMQILKSKKDT